MADPTANQGIPAPEVGASVIDTDYEIGQSNVEGKLGPFGFDIHNPVFMISALSIVAFVFYALALPEQASTFFGWLRPFLDNGAAFMTINNTGGRTDQLLAAQCSCAKKVTVHETRMDGEVMRMAEVSRLAIPGYTSTELSPTGHHIMLEGWSASVILQEVLAIYRALLAGEELELDTPRPYRDYIAWLHTQDPASHVWSSPQTRSQRPQ